jgi:ribonuclease P protein component
VDVKLFQEEEQKEEKEFRLKTSPQMIKFKSLNRSKDFLKILKKKKLNTKYYTIYFDRNSNNLSKYLNISFVMKKKIGNAVTRNKIKRKLKYAIQKIARESKLIDPNYTYVIFGKNNVYKDKFAYVLNEVNETFKKIKQMESRL